MFRVGIIGAENSHAKAFAEIFNGYVPEYRDEFADIRVVGVAGDYPEANQAVFEACGLDFVAERPEDLLGKVDAVMVTARDGRRHAAFARPFIEAGIPAFIDKPFTSDPAEALMLARLAKEKGVPLVGGSSVKLCEDVLWLREQAQDPDARLCAADVTAPVSLHNDYGDFWFYSAHLAESALRIFGAPEWIWASRHEGGVTAVAHYPKVEVTNHFTESAYHYSGTLMTDKGTLHRPIDISGIYHLECRAFADMLRHGRMECTYEDLVRPVFYLAAVERSAQTGEKVTLPEVRV